MKVLCIVVLIASGCMGKQEAETQARVFLSGAGFEVLGMNCDAVENAATCVARVKGVANPVAIKCRQSQNCEIVKTGD